MLIFNLEDLIYAFWFVVPTNSLSNELGEKMETEVLRNKIAFQKNGGILWDPLWTPQTQIKNYKKHPWVCLYIQGKKNIYQSTSLGVLAHTREKKIYQSASLGVLAHTRQKKYIPICILVCVSTHKAKRKYQFVSLCVLAHPR